MGYVCNIREGRVSALGVKVKRVRANSDLVVRSQHSAAVRRNAHLDDVSRCERRTERMLSFLQIWRNTGLDEEVITVAYSFFFLEVSDMAGAQCTKNGREGK